MTFATAYASVMAVGSGRRDDQHVIGRPGESQHIRVDARTGVDDHDIELAFEFGKCVDDILAIEVG